MRVKSQIAAAGVAGLLAATMPAIPAEAAPARDAAAICRKLDAKGVLTRAKATRGECVNLFKGPSSPKANNQIAAACGIDFLQRFLGVNNKGQCIKELRGENLF
jgi:hypothetical protein